MCTEDRNMHLTALTATHWAIMNLCKVTIVVNTTYLLINAEQIKLSCQFSEACAQLTGKSNYHKL